MTDPHLTSLLHKADALVDRMDTLLGRLDAALPRPAPPPDWSASTAFRFRRRSGIGHLEAVRRVSTIRLADLKEVDAQRDRLVRNTEQFVAGRQPTTCCSPALAAPARAR